MEVLYAIMSLCTLIKKGKLRVKLSEKMLIQYSMLSIA